MASEDLVTVEEVDIEDDVGQNWFILVDYRRWQVRGASKTEIR